MEYEKKYRQRKEMIILDLKNAFEKCQNLLNQIDFNINSINFENGRSDDDFIVVQLHGRDESIIKIIFWINFWIKFEFNNSDFVIIYEIYKKGKKILEKTIKYNQIQGCSLDDKSCNLLGDIIYQRRSYAD